MTVQDTFRTYYGDGMTLDFPIPFTYELPSEVKVTVDGIVNITWTFVNPSVIRMASPPINGAALTVERVTNIDSPAVLWKNGSSATGTQFNAMVRQLINAMQEARDTALRGLFRKPTGEYDFLNARAANVGDPVADTDAVNKRWVETAPASNIVEAITARAGAEAARDKAGQWADANTNVQVEPGKYSAKHWAQTAEAIVGVPTALGITFTPAGGVSSNNVQSAIQELDTEKLNKTQVSAFGETLVAAAAANDARTLLGVQTRVLSTVDVSTAVAFVDFTLPSGYRSFKLTYDGVQGVSDNQALSLRVSLDGGSTFVSAVSYWVLVGVRNAVVGYSTASTASASCTLTRNINKASTSLGASGSAMVLPGSTTRSIRLQGRSHYFVATSGQEGYDFDGYLIAGSAATTIRLFMASGNIERGSFTLEGVA